MLTRTVTEAIDLHFYQVYLKRGFVINIKAVALEQAQGLAGKYSRNWFLLRAGVVSPVQAQQAKAAEMKLTLGYHSGSLSNGQQQRIRDYLDRASPNRQAVVQEQWDECGERPTDDACASDANHAVALDAFASEQEVSDFYHDYPELACD
ncbi:hypothetical protein [Hymenobacter defluvii]|uniref:Uncharacterized protein n=1 Tax=Hymenobacter defluvii TaxID=2054411 RepID=A0ABS3THI7_9BACT|nr:hypothetical protein [Hymenobacter defluvii]MBO3273115.1 hypothetical protein [Hymenobacter defluvii]